MLVWRKISKTNKVIGNKVFLDHDKYHQDNDVFKVIYQPICEIEL